MNNAQMRKMVKVSSWSFLGIMFLGSLYYGTTSKDEQRKIDSVKTINSILYDSLILFRNYEDSINEIQYKIDSLKNVIDESNSLENILNRDKKFDSIKNSKNNFYQK